MIDRTQPRALAWLQANRQDLPLGLAIAAGIVAVMLVIRWFGARLCASDPDCTRWRGVIGRVLAKTGILFMIATALDIVATYAGAPSRITRLTDIAFTVTAAIQGAVWGRELILGVITHRVGDDRETTIGNATAVIRVLVNVTLFALALLLILDNLGVNVTALVAGLGIGGIAIGLAAQGIFADLFAALSILFDRPFRRGDLIRYGNTTGTVERIGLKTTRLRSLSGEQVIMANTKLLDQEIHNLAEAKARRISVTFGVAVETSKANLDQLETIGCQAANAQSGCKAVRCVLSSVSAGSLNFELVYDDRSRDNNVIARNRSAILLAMVHRFAEARISLATAAGTPATAAAAT